MFAAVAALSLLGAADAIRCYDCTNPKGECNSYGDHTHWPSSMDHSKARCVIAIAKGAQWPWLQKAGSIDECEGGL